jgi:hypothetical protein
VAGHSGGARWLAGELAGEINGVEMGLICLQAGGAERGRRKETVEIRWAPLDTRRARE